MHANGLRLFRNSFKQHLVKLDPRLKAMEVSPCGSTEDTIRDYARAVRENKADFVPALLVDSDTPVTVNSPAEHLRIKLDSAKVQRDARTNIFLMVQCMESWFVTDPTALKACFGDQFRENALPPNPDIEAVAKRDVLAALEATVKPTPARHYHKIHHGMKILVELNPDTVAQRSKHARDLHAFLHNSVQM
ncbi:MAG: DUF4276 family protein [Terracidiphilus sp.]|jgi:hypothetical protein